MILHSADGIARDPDVLLEILAGNVDAAKTILACAAHQKRVIDDVLILNRLEHARLSITPVLVNISELIDSIANMFQFELDADGTSLTTVRDPSFDQHVTSLFFCDPSRLTQVFLNLLSNSIKFIRGCPLRNIIIRYGSSLEPPEEETATMTEERLRFIPTAKQHRDLTEDKEWGQGEVVYRRFSVQDTGPGLDPEELNRLFQRFSRANAKTHITYGGAGLGLYISQELTEVQGGKVGVTSTPSVCTTFAFYIKTRRGQSEETTQHGRVLDPKSTVIARPHATSPTIIVPSELTQDCVSGSPTVAFRNRTQNVYKISLLLVEDNLVNQKILRKQLQMIGCRVHVANHGVELLTSSRKTQHGIQILAANAPLKLI